jgi:hypothetical protein
MKHLIPKIVFTLNVVASYFVSRFVCGYLDLTSFGDNWRAAIGVAVFCLSYCAINFTMYLMVRNRATDNTPIFEFNEYEGHIYYPGDTGHKIPWKDVEKIEIFTSDDGPWSEDLWWLFFLKGKEEPVDVPNGSKGISKIFDVMKTHFDEADMGSIAKAIGSTNNNSFRVWKEK